MKLLRHQLWITLQIKTKHELEKVLIYPDFVPWRSFGYCIYKSTFFYPSSVSVDFCMYVAQQEAGLIGHPREREYFLMSVNKDLATSWK